MFWNQYSVSWVALRGALGVLGGLLGGVFGEFDTDFLVFSRANSVQACPEPRVFAKGELQLVQNLVFLVKNAMQLFQNLVFSH